ncbi:MAG: class II aldolase/adducin family protein, partial [Acidobacteriota bacterium]
MENRWGTGPSPGSDEVEALLHLSHLVGSDNSLVQSGGGNSSIKLPSPPSGIGDRSVRASGAKEEAVLMVKGSGIDLQVMERKDLTRLSMARLACLADVAKMTDEAMMEFMGACMLAPHTDPLPSVETHLHAILPSSVVIHTHDVATLSITNQEDGTAVRILRDLYQDRVAHLPYVRPGFPLARAVSARVSSLAPQTCALALAHHGLVVWGDTARECHGRLVELISAAEDYLAERLKGRHVLGVSSPQIHDTENRTRQAEIILPVIRGELGCEEPVILGWDTSAQVLDLLARPRFKEVSGRGMATPEHLLRAGRLPLWIDLPAGDSDEEIISSLRQQIDRQRRDYLAYHHRHAVAGSPPLSDWAKVLLIPGLGMVTAFKDAVSAGVAASC